MANEKITAHDAVSILRGALVLAECAIKGREHTGFITKALVATEHIAAAQAQGEPSDALPKWIDDQKGKDPGIDDLIHYIERILGQQSGGSDTTRLDFVLERQAFIFTVPESKTGRPPMYQLMEQDEDEDFQVISGEGEAFRTKREAIDAAIAAIQAQAGEGAAT